LLAILVCLKPETHSGLSDRDRSITQTQPQWMTSVLRAGRSLSVYPILDTDWQIGKSRYLVTRPELVRGDLAIRRSIERVVFEVRTEIANVCQQMADKCGEPP
jgi:hypothetical protein